VVGGDLTGVGRPEDEGWREGFVTFGNEGWSGRRGEGLRV